MNLYDLYVTGFEDMSDMVTSMKYLDILDDLFYVCTPTDWWCQLRGLETVLRGA